MDKAFDVRLNRIIGVSEYQANEYSYRMHDMVCPCCQKDVRFIHSEQYQPYFRHAHSTYSLNCEKYVAAIGNRSNSLSVIEKHKEVGITLKWGKDNTIEFFVNIKFTDEQIQKYEDNGSYFRYWVSNNGNAIEHAHSYKISYESFIPDENIEIILDNIGNQLYYEMAGKKNSLDLLNSFILYKVKGDFELNCHNSVIASSLNSRNIYVDKPYVLLVKNSKLREIQMSGINIFAKTEIGHDMVALLLIIPTYNYLIKDLLNEYSYELIEASEKCEFLWPPIIETKDGFYTNKGTIYMRTNFELKKGVNINSDFNTYGEICEVVVPDKMKIYYNDEINAINAREALNTVYQTYQPIVKSTGQRNLLVQKDNCYLFSPNRPIMALSNGSPVWLMDGVEIREYQGNYLVVRITAPEAKKQLKIPIDEILQNNKVETEFHEKDLLYLENDENIIKYLNNCRRQRRINLIIQDTLRRSLND